MARKAADNQGDVIQETLTEEPEGTKAVKESKNPWKDMVKIKLPKAPRGESNYIIASVNGKVYKIQKGVTVDVPRPIAKVIENSMNDADRADEFIEQHVFE